MSGQLLDVNVLLALCDPLHADHDLTHRWFERRKGEWATCAITENGFIRIASNPAYPNAVASLEVARTILAQLAKLPGHSFWDCSLSLRSSARFQNLAELKSGALTDVFLLGLAAEQGGKLVTLDRKIPVQAVRGGKNAIELITS